MSETAPCLLPSSRSFRKQSASPRPDGISGSKDSGPVHGKAIPMATPAAADSSEKQAGVNPAVAGIASLNLSKEAIAHWVMITFLPLRSAIVLMPELLLAKQP